MKYAQSILELFREVRRDGYDHADLCLIRDAYILAMRAFTGLVRPSGKLFIDHCVGTASVLHSAGAPPSVTCAGVLHSIYQHGGLIRWGKGASSAARSEVKASVGAEVEGLVAGYAALKWNRTTIPAIATDVPSYDAFGRGVVLIRLANEVDENLDGGVLYLAEAERRRNADRPIVPFLVMMAQQLGYANLADELSRVFDDTWTAALPDSKPQTLRRVSVLVPRSCRKRLGSRLAHRTVRLIRGRS